MNVLCVVLAGWLGFAAVYPVVVAERGVTLRVEVAGWGGR